MSESRFVIHIVVPATCLLVGGLGCIDRTLQSVPGADELSPCPAFQTVDTRGWNVKRMPWLSLEPVAVESWAQPLEVEFCLPACFSEDRDDEQWFMHGGKMYRCGDRRVEFSYGYWGPQSFGEDMETCVTEVGGLRVLVMQSRDRWFKSDKVLAWYGMRGGHHLEPLLTATSPNARDLPLLRTIAISGRQLVTIPMNRRPDYALHLTAGVLGLPGDTDRPLSLRGTHG